MAMIETKADYEFANTVKELEFQVGALKKELSELKEINDTLSEVNSRLLTAVTNNNELICELISQMKKTA